MDRTIRYARTRDGVQIAYWTLGKGEPLLYMAGGPWNHIEVWEVPQCRAWYEKLAEGARRSVSSARSRGGAPGASSGFAGRRSARFVPEWLMLMLSRGGRVFSLGVHVALKGLFT